MNGGTVDEVTKEIIDFLKSNKAEDLYKQPFVNRKGKCKKSDKFYTEIMADIIDAEGCVEKLFEIEPIQRNSSYRVESHHDGSNKQTDTNRKEEIFVKELYKKQITLNKLGKIIDFQIPLKNTNKDKGLGKIDLFTYNETTRIAYLVEFKGEDSKETALRAVLEIATYYQLLDKKKFIKDFDIQIPIENIKKAVLFMENTNPAKEVVDEKRKALCNIMKKLNVEAVISNSFYHLVEIK